MLYSTSRHVSFVAMLLFLCSLIFTNISSTTMVSKTNANTAQNVCLYVHTVRGARCISYYRPQNGGQYCTGPEVQYQLCNEQVGNNCVPDLPIYHTTVLYCPLYAV